MAVKLNSPGWTTRGVVTRGARVAVDGLPSAFVPVGARTEEVVVVPPAPARGAPSAPGPLDLSVDLGPGEAAVLAVRHPSGALTFHPPRETTRRARSGPGDARFIVPVRPAAPPDGAATRGIVSAALKVVVVKVADEVIGSLVDHATGFVLSKLAVGFETLVWKKKGLAEGWLKVTKGTLAARALKTGVPSSAERSLLLLHGTFSNAAHAFGPLVASTFFDDVRPLYADRIFGFDHFTVSREPAENARQLLEALPKGPHTFDVITHSRGGLVLRHLVEQSSSFGALGTRFRLGRAVLVAVPNEGTPLATPSRWEETVGWIANLLELFPIDNPFTTGAEFVANALVWMARQASGNLPGLHAMDGDTDSIRQLQTVSGSAVDRYSVLASNYVPTGNLLARLADLGIDQFFGGANDLVVPSEGGWRLGGGSGVSIPGTRIGCFGLGGNIPRSDVHHANFFAQPETVRFLVEALKGEPHRLPPIDPAQPLPDRRLVRSAALPAAEPPASRALARTRRLAPASAPDPAGDHLRLAVVNGDLTFEERPLLIGHYRATTLTGSEKVIDGLLDGAMTASLNRGVYPLEPGTHRIFANESPQSGRYWRSPRPAAVVVAGLGQEGKLQPAHVVYTVRQAVLAWAERCAEALAGRHPARGSTGRATGSPPPPLALAATLLASGGTGVSPGQSAQLVVQGVLEANDVIRRLPGKRPLPLVGELRFVELYLTRATEAWEALTMVAHASPGRVEVAAPIVEGGGALRRPLDSNYRGADYDFITAETRTDAAGRPMIAYALDTRRARTEVQAQSTQVRLLRDLVATASSDATTDEQISRTLYNLLVPIELEAFLANSGETQIELDEGTAGIPWELLSDRAASDEPRLPWAIRSKLLRKLRTETYRAQVNDADLDASVLVIGQPLSPPDYPPLPGALAEAKDVADLLGSDRGIGDDRLCRLFAGGAVTESPDSRQVIDALYARSWRIVHVAGHGAPPDASVGGAGGVVLSNDTFLGASELGAMRVVPELVFVNCCHLGAAPPDELLTERRVGVYDRVAFAAGVAQALIRIGVRCVVAAGWAVDDAAASAFATSFYEALLGGQRFIDAVAAARAKAFEFAGNTWAAYQCYGDADWRFRRPASSGRARARSDEFDFVASVPTLRHALQTLSVQSTFQGKAPAIQRERLRCLEARWQAMGWRANDEIAAPFARAYAAAGDLANAIRWYEAGVAASDGDVSLRSIEQLANLRIRQAMAAVDGAGSGAAHRTAVREARETIAVEASRLERLEAFAPTVERASLLGSAMKRLSMLERLAGRKAAERQALASMASHYRRALGLARRAEVGNLFYPAINLVAAELARGGAGLTRRLPASLFVEARASVAALNAVNPDFWSLIAEPELRLYEALAHGTIAREAAAIIHAFTDVNGRSQDAREWASVGDTLRFVLDPCAARATGREAAALGRIRAAVSALEQERLERSRREAVAQFVDERARGMADDVAIRLTPAALADRDRLSTEERLDFEDFVASFATRPVAKASEPAGGSTRTERRELVVIEYDIASPGVVHVTGITRKAGSAAHHTKAARRG